MSIASDYRQLAEEQRRAADRTVLLMVRLKHLAAAEKWEIMAEEIEHFEATRVGGASQVPPHLRH